MAELAHRLRRVRLLSGLSGRALAGLAGVSHSMVNYIERGDGGSVSGDTACKLADTLGTSVDYLLRGVGSPPTRDEVLTAVRRAQSRQARAEAG